MRLSVIVVLFRLVSKEDISTTKSIMDVDDGLYIPKSIIALLLLIVAKIYIYIDLTRAMP